MKFQTYPLVESQSLSIALHLLVCIAIDVIDIASAQLSSAAGLSDTAEARSLKLTAIAALVPELTALVLLTVRKTQEQIDKKEQVKRSKTIA